MDLKIDELTTLGDIQKEFSSLYPHLRIEFLRQQHSTHRPTANSWKFDSLLPALSVSSFRTSGIISLDCRRTVADIEQDFLTTFGIQVAVLRQEGQLWIKASLAENWSLDQQNEIGAPQFLSTRQEVHATEHELL